ncbi:MAG: N-acetylmuramoyl-L-alanine amidase [Anaerolineae bacterium]|nr:N-acetylmuramoyl-L-alanine amidase [Anaerolineae bacterium]
MARSASRRDFLGLAGLTAVAAGLSCIGGALGYLALDYLTSGSPTSPAPAPSGPSSNRVKHIDCPPIIARAEWNARAPDHSAKNEPGFYSAINPLGWCVYDGDLRTIYRTVIVHHSVLYEKDDPVTMRTIQDLHIDSRGWADIAYHFAVGKSGQVFEGRALDVRGAHVSDYNTGSLGVVFFGDFEHEVPTPEQLNVGRQLINWLALRLELTHLAGHSEFNDFTECPGRYMIYYLDALAESAGLSRGTGGYQPPE